MVAKKNDEALMNLNVTVVALVALVALVGTVAMVLSAGGRRESGTVGVGEILSPEEANLAGDAKMVRYVSESWGFDAGGYSATKCTSDNQCREGKCCQKSTGSCVNYNTQTGDCPK